jgi:hypothetical protein
MFGFRRWVLRPLIQRVTTQAEVWESRIFARLNEIEHKVLTIAEVLLIRGEQLTPTTVCVMWCEEVSAIRLRRWQSQRSGGTAEGEEPALTPEQLAKGLAPRCFSIGAWLAAGETKQLEVPAFRPIPAGAWVVSLGPAWLRSVHVGNELQDMGGAATAGRICVLGDAVDVGQRLSVTLEQPGKGTTYRS